RAQFNLSQSDGFCSIFRRNRPPPAHRRNPSNPWHELPIHPASVVFVRILGSFAMDPVQTLSYSEWNPTLTSGQSTELAKTLESGMVLYLPDLHFDLDPIERKFLTPQWLSEGRKSIFVQGPERLLKGSVAEGKDRADLRSMIERFGMRATRLIQSFFPMYA